MAQFHDLHLLVTSSLLLFQAFWPALCHKLVRLSQLPAFTWCPFLSFALVPPCLYLIVGMKRQQALLGPEWRGWVRVGPSCPRRVGAPQRLHSYSSHCSPASPIPSQVPCYRPCAIPSLRFCHSLQLLLSLGGKVGQPRWTMNRPQRIWDKGRQARQPVNYLDSGLYAGSVQRTGNSACA